MKTNSENQIAIFVPFKASENPHNVKLKDGGWYKINDNYGAVKEVKIISIRNINGEFVVNFKWKSKNNPSRRPSLFNFWNLSYALSTTWGFGAQTLEAFKTQMIDYGKVSEIQINHPGIQQ